MDIFSYFTYSYCIYVVLIRYTCTVLMIDNKSVWPVMVVLTHEIDVNMAAFKAVYKSRKLIQ